MKANGHDRNDFLQTLAEAILRLQDLIRDYDVPHGIVEIRLATEYDGAYFRHAVISSPSYSKMIVAGDEEHHIEVCGARFTWPETVHASLKH